MRAITVSVEYADLLNLTLAYNRHHFEEVMVVTTPQDDATQRVATRNKAELFLTNAFYENGAYFNKWLALEEGLDKFKREGLLCIMDADVLWPQSLMGWEEPPQLSVRWGTLYSPQRRIWEDVHAGIPREQEWQFLPLFRDFEFAGYSQIFWADDPHLPPAPWHELDWNHAGGADSSFQRLWPNKYKIRPPWQVLHLGRPGTNWTGRTTPLLSGKVPIQAEERKKTLQWLMRQRGTTGTYEAERLR